MAVAHALGTFSVPGASTTAISPSLTWSDAGSHTPQAILFFCHIGAAGTHTADDGILGVGMTDGTRHFATYCRMRDGVNSTEARLYQSDNAPIVEINTSGTLTGVVDFTSFGTDTFTVTPSDAFAETHVVFYIAFAGYDNAYCLARALPAGTGNFSDTNPGFLPNVAFVTGGFHSTIDAGTTGAKAGFGFASAAGAQFAASYNTRNAQTSNYTSGLVKSGVVLVTASPATGAVQSEVALVSFDATGATFNHVTAGGANYFGTLFLKGGAVVATTTTHQTGTGTFTAAATGVNPSLVIGLTNNTATASQSAGVEGAHFAVGALLSSGTQWGINLHSYNNETLGGATVTEEYIHSGTDKFMPHFDRTAADTFAATGIITESSLASELITLDQTDANTALVYLPIIALGEVVAGGGSAIAAISAGYHQRGLR